MAHSMLDLFPSLFQAFSIPERFWKALDGPVLDLLPDKVIKWGKTPFFPEEAALIQPSLERQRSFGSVYWECSLGMV